MSSKGLFHMRSPLEALSEELDHGWGWFFALGLVLIALGIGAATFAFRTTVVSVIVFGWILLLAGVAFRLLSFLIGRSSGFFLSLSAGILSIIAGVMLLSDLVAVVLGAMLFAGWPEVSLWFLGFYVGIDLVIHGFAWCMFATSLRVLTRSIAPEERRHPAA